MTMKRYRPARGDLVVPMPDRDNRPLPDSGARIDLGKPYYRRLLDDGDIVEVGKKPDRQANKRRPNRNVRHA